MCIIFYSDDLDSHELVLAANRDEFLARPTSLADWHDFGFSTPPNNSSIQDSQINENVKRYLSGLDLSGGGTWLGLALPRASPPSNQGANADNSIKLRFSTLTNYTESLPPSSIQRPSRGDLVKSFLTFNSTSPYIEEYLSSTERTKDDYAGFNLLVGELSEKGFEMGYISNREPVGMRGRIVDKGKEVKGLSNSTLVLRRSRRTEEDGEGGKEDRWPKVVDGCERFENVVGKGFAVERESEVLEGLWGLLRTSSSQPIRERSHLRHTILVRPLLFDPSAPLPPVIPPLPTTSTPTTPKLEPNNSIESTEKNDPSVLASREEMEIESNEKIGRGGKHWYATRVQTVITISKPFENACEGVEKGKRRVKFWEREAYVLAEDGRPEWSGRVRQFEFLV